MECIAYNLWNVIAKTPNGMISVDLDITKIRMIHQQIGNPISMVIIYGIDNIIAKNL